MRKLTPLFATLAAILCLCFSAVACNKQNASKIAGTYKLSSMTMTMGGATVTLEAGKDFMGTQISEDTIVLVLKEDKTYEMTSALESDEDATVTGTWDFDGNSATSIILSDPEETSSEESSTTMTATIDGDKLTMTESTTIGEGDSAQTTEMTITFKKA